VDPAVAERVVNFFFSIITWMVLIRVILSWIPHNPKSPLLRILYEVTDPILAPIRRLMPKSGMALDFSPIIAIILLGFVQRFIINLIHSIL
jgi:YggT family protein